MPKGTLAGQWNLILRSCSRCNDLKADLEDDISAITMQPDAGGHYASDDPRLRAEAVRKARTRNRRTSRRVSEPNHPIEVKHRFGPAEISFSFVSPAQPDERRMYALARFQLAGFFYLLTFDDETRLGFCWPGVFAPIVFARKEDWGNPQLRWIEDATATWDYRLQAITAEGFYKAWIRKQPGDAAIWAWAIEWNLGVRLAGFFGEEEPIRQILRDLPQLDMITICDRPEQRLRMRPEFPLAEHEDTLFEWANAQRPSANT